MNYHLNVWPSCGHADTILIKTSHFLELGWCETIMVFFFTKLTAISISKGTRVVYWSLIGGGGPIGWIMGLNSKYYMWSKLIDIEMINDAHIFTNICKGCNPSVSPSQWRVQLLLHCLVPLHRTTAIPTAITF